MFSSRTKCWKKNRVDQQYIQRNCIEFYIFMHYICQHSYKCAYIYLSTLVKSVFSLGFFEFIWKEQTSDRAIWGPILNCNGIIWVTKLRIYKQTRPKLFFFFFIFSIRLCLVPKKFEVKWGGKKIKRRLCLVPEKFEVKWGGKKIKRKSRRT